MRFPATRQIRRQTQTRAFTHDTVYIAFSDKEISIAYTEETVITVGSHSWAEIDSDYWANHTTVGCKPYAGFFFGPLYPGLSYVDTIEHDVR